MPETAAENAMQDTDTKSYKRQLQIIKNGGYATSGSYVSQLSRVINTYNLTQWDK